LPAGKKVKTDFFITYHHDDELAARWIADILLKVPFSLFMESWDFLPGTQPLEKIDYMLTHSCTAAVLVSRRWLRVGVEPGTRQTVIHKYPGPGAPALLLLRIDSCDLQQALGTVAYTDLYGIKAGEAANRLLKAAGAAAPDEGKKETLPLTPTTGPGILDTRKKELDLLLARTIKHHYHMTLNLETEVEKEVKIKDEKTGRIEKQMQRVWEAVPIERVLTDGNHYLLVNPSGMGKTTFLTYAAGMLLDRTKGYPFVPLLTTCIAINERSGSIGDFIDGQVESLYKNAQTGVVKDDWENLCILIDALDQARDVDEIVSSLLLPNRFTHYRKAKIILSSRQNTADKVKKGFKIIRLKLPVDDEVRLYLGEENYKKLVGHIQASRELVTVPVLLEMLKTITEKGGDAIVLENRAGLYTEFTKILMDQERNKPRFWQDSPAVHHFIENELEQALEKIAFFSLADNKILEIEKETLGTYCETPEKKETLLNIGILLELFEDREQKVVFRHQSFQAYFSARYMYYRRPDLFKEITKDIRFFYSDVWYEVMRFFVGLNRNPEKAGEIIDTMYQAEDKKVNLNQTMRLIFSFFLMSEARVSREIVQRVSEKIRDLLKKEAQYRKFFIFNTDKFNKVNDEQRRNLFIIIEPLMRDKDWKVRDTATEALGKIVSTKDIPLLEPLLRDDDWRVRCAAATTSGQIGAAKDIPFLEPLLWDENDSVRYAAAEALGEIGTAKDIPLLEPLLRDNDWHVRSAAVRAFGKIDTSGHFPLLEPLLRDKNEFVSHAVNQALMKIVTAGDIPLLKPLLRDEDKDVRRAAVKALGKIGAAGDIPLIEPLLKDKEWYVRSAAAETLGEIGTAKDISLLESLFRDEAFDVHSTAAKAFGKIVTVKGIPLLEPLFGNGDLNVRRAAAEVLGEIGTAEDIPLIEPLLKDKEWYVRSTAAEALGKIGTADHIPLLEPLFGDENSSVRFDAAKALGKIGAAEDIPLLEPLLKDKEWYVRIAAVEALGKIGTSDHIHLLESLIRDEDDYVCIDAVKALGKIGTSKDIHLLESLLRDKFLNLRNAAVETLGNIGTTEHIPLLEPLLRDVEWYVHDNTAAKAIEVILKRSATELRVTIPEPEVEARAGKTVILQIQNFITPPLHILHISDIHYSAENDPPITRIFHEFLKDIKKWREQHHNEPIHAICLTGDIAFSGQKDQYASIHKRINEILKVSGCSQDRLFLIPGNHDVHEYNKFPEECKKIMKKAVKDDTHIDRILNDFEKYRPFHDKFTHYYGYVETSGFANSCPETRGGKPKPWYSRRLKGFPVRVIGLNSALFCLKPYSERDKIRMGKRQLEEAYFHEKSLDTEREELVLLLTHHPADWLRETEKDEYTALMDSFSVVHLHGHVHKLEIKEVRSLSGSAYMLIGTGSIYGENGTNHINTYHIMTLDFEQQEIHIWGRRWEPGYGFWTVFADNTRNVFPFPGKYEKKRM
jgi:HEAT repeat protein/predicted MPP superfamily phosphohydrolase/energy-coupling factor transporter ATP-binding protein EcfA2